MAIILCVDTAGEQASVGLCNGEKIMASETSDDLKNHSAFLQTAIQKIMQAAQISFQQIEAVAVVNGPGSYTGLRVGLASAKGICYAAGLPLILMSTLEVMALAAIAEYNDKTALYCPMIDARRTEVFTAVYNFFRQPVLHPQPVIAETSRFSSWLSQQNIYFFGSGHNKCKQILAHEKAVFINIDYGITHTNELAQHLYEQKQFASIAYAEPYYTKEFYLPGT